MPPSIPSNASPVMLKWAREQQGLSIEEVASATKLDATKIKNWESGNGTPSLAQLKKLAACYRRPSMVFYLAAPPDGFKLVEDFRLIGKASRSRSQELRLALRLAQERQEWISGYLEEIGADRCELVGAFTAGDDPIQVGHWLRSRLGITIAQQVACATDYDSLALWRHACERNGVYVFQASHVTIAEMRGCALPDVFAPVAILNSSDAPAARVFTLLHEMAHLVINKSAIDASLSGEFAFDNRQKVEQFCNRVSAETLVPREDFLVFMPSRWHDRPDYHIRQAARRYRVSRAVIGYRLVETGMASEAFLAEKWQSLQSKAKTSSGPVPQHVLALARVGREFASIALCAYYDGAIHGGELAGLLRMKLNHLHNLESSLAENRAQLTS